MPILGLEFTSFLQNLTQSANRIVTILRAPFRQAQRNRNLVLRYKVVIRPHTLLGVAATIVETVGSQRKNSPPFRNLACLIYTRLSDSISREFCCFDEKNGVSARLRLGPPPRRAVFLWLFRSLRHDICNAQVVISGPGYPVIS
jgi:hypothetical protein